MFTKTYWLKVLERFVRAFATAFVLTASAAEKLVGEGEQISLTDRLGIGLIQGIGSIALSLVGGQVGDHETPSLLPVETPETQIEGE